MAAHQAPLSLGFSRQEHWSGLPFSSPMNESEKWKWIRSVVSDPRRPHGLQPSRLLLRGNYASVYACIPVQSRLTLCDPARLFCPWDSPGKNTRVGYHFLLQGSSQPRDQTRVFCIGRWVLYQLIHWGSPQYASNESKLKSWWSIISCMPGWQKLK